MKKKDVKSYLDNFVLSQGSFSGNIERILASITALSVLGVQIYIFISVNRLWLIMLNKT